MKYLSLFILLLLSALNVTCDDIREAALDIIDSGPNITEAEAVLQEYDLETLTYGMKVKIRNDVDGNEDDILELLDQRAADFLDCQFGDPDIGLDDFQIPGDGTVGPLSELRVFVVTTNFECDAVDKDICAGIYYRSPDIIVIADEGFGRCGELPLFKHEVGHRYGMTANHSNQDEFEPCINPPNCGG